MTEEWRHIPTAPYYAVSSFGRVRRVAPYVSTRVGRILKERDNGNGYLCVTLSHKGSVKVRYVHQLVAEAFHGERPIGFVAAHLDGNRQNNRPQNIRWVTRKENEAHKELHGTKREGERCYQCALSDHQVRLMRAHVAFGETVARAARVFGVSYDTAHKIVRGKSRRSAGGYL